jgi:hypothetical protein
VRRKKLQQITLNFQDQFGGGDFIKTLMIVDNQVVMADGEHTKQRTLHGLHKITNSYNLEISIENTKVMAFSGKQPMRKKLVLENQVIGQGRKFNFLGCYISLSGSRHKSQN